MKIRLIALAVLVAVSTGAVIGAPLHSGEHSCAMNAEMAGMDCCKKAAMGQGATPEVSAARLCCALNCSSEGSLPANNATPSQSSQNAIVPHLAIIIKPVQPVVLIAHSAGVHDPPVFSHPVYIRHLALLI